MLLLWACLLTAQPVVLDGVDVTGWTTEQLWALADKYYHDGKYLEAVHVQQRICTIDPGDVESYAVAAWLLWSLGDEPAGRRMLLAAVRANPDAWDSHWELGYHDFERNGDPARAIPSLERAVALSGWPPYAIRTLAHAYVYAEEPSRAVPLWERIGRDGLGPPGLVQNNLGRVLEQALRTDLAARSGGVVSGPPRREAVRILSDRITAIDADDAKWVRVTTLEAADGADGVPDMRIYARGSTIIYKKAWHWVAIDCDTDGDGRFGPDETLLDEDGDGIAESLPPIDALRTLREGLSPEQQRLRAPDRYELGAGADGRPVPLDVRLEDGHVMATPAFYLATALDGLVLRLMLVEAVKQEARFVATAPLPPGVYCGNQPGLTAQAAVALPLADLPPGRYAVALQIGYRTATLDQKPLRWCVLVRDEHGATLEAADAWSLFEPDEPPVESPDERAMPAGGQGHQD